MNKEPSALAILLMWAVIGLVIWAVVALVKEYGWVGYVMQAPFALGACCYLWETICHPLDAMWDSVNNRGDGGGV